LIILSLLLISIVVHGCKKDDGETTTTNPTTPDQISQLPDIDVNPLLLNFGDVEVGECNSLLYTPQVKTLALQILSSLL